MSARKARHDARQIGELQKAQQKDEFRRALRGLLMSPLMIPTHVDFVAVRRQAERVSEWFMREAGWPLHVDREGARLFKRPADISDASRGLPDYDRRRYVLLCLACAVLERADAQISLRTLGERVVQQATDPDLAASGYSFKLDNPHERRELVAVCRSLLEFGVLERVAGEEANFVHDSGWQQSDALYDVHRRLLASLLAAVRGPSTWTPEEAPHDTDARIQALVAEYAPDSEQGRRDALRHHLSRRLLDDPVIYNDTLDAEALGYFGSQRGPMAARLGEALGLSAEQRAEGLALVDESGQLSDVSMPAEGTDAHVALLVAEHLATQLRQVQTTPFTDEAAIALFLREATARYGRFWRKSARADGAERELAAIAIKRLCQLGLLRRDEHGLTPLPAIARYSLGQAEVHGGQGSELTVLPSLF